MTYIGENLKQIFRLIFIFAVDDICDQQHKNLNIEMQIFLNGIGPTHTLNIDNNGTLLDLMDRAADKLKMHRDSFWMINYNHFVYDATGKPCHSAIISMNSDNLLRKYSIKPGSTFVVHYNFHYFLTNKK